MDSDFESDTCSSLPIPNGQLKRKPSQSTGSRNKVARAAGCSSDFESDSCAANGATDDDQEQDTDDLSSIYIPPDDEEIEHEGLEVLNETPPDEIEAGEADELPCRTLDNFTVFDQDNNNMIVDLSFLGAEGTDITISGDVESLDINELGEYYDTYQADIDEDDDFDDTGSNFDLERPGSASGFNDATCPRSAEHEPRSSRFVHRIRLSAILRYETYMVKGGDTEVWVCTCFGWYKLLNPHPNYVAAYTPFYKSIFIAHQAIRQANTNPEMTLDDFAKKLRQNPCDVVSRLSPIVLGDMELLRELIVEELQSWIREPDQVDLFDTALISALCGIPKDAKSKKKRVRKSKPSNERPNNAVSRSVRGRSGHATIGEPKRENPACITPLVASVAKGLYARELLNVSSYESTDASTKAASKKDAKGKDASADVWRKRYAEVSSKAKLGSADKVKGIISVPDLQRCSPVQYLRANNISCIPDARIPNTDESRLYYSSISVIHKSSAYNGEVLEDVVPVEIGETVLIAAPTPLPGSSSLLSLWESSSNDRLQSNDSGELVTGPFARVMQVVSISRNVSNNEWELHARLLLPGRDTVLQEVSLPNEWYLVDECQTYSFKQQFCGKISVPFIATNVELDVDALVAESRLFCRFWYERGSGMFEDVNKHLQGQDGYIQTWCMSCKQSEKKTDIKLGRALGGVRRGVTSTLNDGDDDGDSEVPMPRRSPVFVETVTVKGIAYHVNDLVYVPSPHQDQPFDIGYIVSFSSKKAFINKRDGTTKSLYADIQILRRMRVIPSHLRPESTEKEYDDARHLFWTPLIRETDTSTFRGKCWIVHPDEIKGSLVSYKDTDFDAFYAMYESKKNWPSSQKDWVELKPRAANVDAMASKHGDDEGDDEDDMDQRVLMRPPCPICKHQREKKLDMLVKFLHHSPAPERSLPGSSGSDKPVSFARGSQRLRALDLFSGCGGLTQGMEQSGVIETKWSVEYMQSAGITFSKNHPNTQVYNQCSNLLLDSAIKDHQKIPRGPLINNFDGKQLPPMPQPGDVDFIYCGPPCQGFSRCNRFIKADDIKTSLIANALSYVDFYRPSYFLLENVRGLLNYRLGGVQVGPGKVKGGIEMGMLKFILRTLTTMGYQARFYVLQAGNYGIAQSRRRLFVWACKRGLRLPGVPQPVTTFGKSKQTQINFPDGTTYAPLAHLNGNAPHHAITVREAIGDLPKFEFVNPADVYPDPDIDNRNPDWPQYIAVNGMPTNIPGDHDGKRGYVGQMEMGYSNPPLSEFQRLRRRRQQICIPDKTEDCERLVDVLYNHVSRKFNSINTERVCRVELQPGKDHSSLPDKLKPWCLSAKESAASRHNGWKGLYGRVDPEGFFGTALTEMSPMGKSGTVLLYDQRRVLTVRECARAQGFPDTFRIYSIKEDDTRDMYRQIGNAVPPPLAYALGLELREALFKDFVELSHSDADSVVIDGDSALDSFLGDFCVDIDLAGAKDKDEAMLSLAPLDLNGSARDAEPHLIEQEVLS
ncbi:hypothetical protein LPJ72_000061 [Coemansia sp. Benny D160-2]|nr:hypothetical protein LPJ72_000061 [Coemansia sp. Benny D160-2]